MFSGDNPEEYFNNRYSNNSGLGNKGCNLNDFVTKLDWKSVSEAINKGDKGTFVERNGYINNFYEILTGKSLGLPDSLE